MVLFDTEILNSDANVPLQTLFLKFWVAVSYFKNLLKMPSSKQRLNKTDMEKVS